MGTHLAQELDQGKNRDIWRTGLDRVYTMELLKLLLWEIFSNISLVPLSRDQ